MAEPTNKREEYYAMQVACANCGKGNAYDTEEYEIFIPKGVKVEDFLERTPCEYCGCYELSKVMNFVFPRLNDSKKKKDKEEKEEEKTDLNDDMPRINMFQKKPKTRVTKIIK